MEIKNLEQKEQPLFSRTELRGTASFEAATPSRQEIRKKISQSLKTDESLVLVKEISNLYGQKVANITAHVYKTKEDAEKFASSVTKKRMAVKKKEGESHSTEKKSEEQTAKPEEKKQDKK